MTKYTLFQWCPVQEKVVPIQEVQKRAQTNARDLFIQDEMPPTRNQIGRAHV